MRPNKVFNHLIKYFFSTKSAVAEVILLLVTAVHVAEIVVQTLSIKHPSSLFGGIFQPMLIKENQFSIKYLVKVYLRSSHRFFPNIPSPSRDCLFISISNRSLV